MPVLSFFFGILGAFGALGLELAYLTFLSISHTPHIFVDFSLATLLVFSFIEELVKFFMLLKLLHAIKNFRLLLTSAILFGIGFSLTETLLISWKYGSSLQWFSLELMAVFCIHILLSILLAFCIFLAQKYSYWYFILGFVLVFFIHSTYNSILKLFFS